MNHEDEGFHCVGAPGKCIRAPVEYYYCLIDDPSYDSDLTASKKKKNAGSTFSTSTLIKCMGYIHAFVCFIMCLVRE